MCQDHQRFFLIFIFLEKFRDSNYKTGFNEKKFRGLLLDFLAMKYGVFRREIEIFSILNSRGPTKPRSAEVSLACGFEKIYMNLVNLNTMRGPQFHA